MLDLHLPGARSLKDKRSPLRSMTTRLRRAGFSVAEVAHHDTWQRSQLAISMVGGSYGDVDNLLDEAVRVCESTGVDVSTRQRTVLSVDDLGN